MTDLNTFVSPAKPANVAFAVISNVPRRGFDKEWAELATRLTLTVAQKTQIEAFMEDVQDAAFQEGVGATG